MIETRILGDLGERNIIDELLRPRYGREVASFGDDCALIDFSPETGGGIVVTTDPCPVPAAQKLGFDDLYYYGWLLATINLSDLAAAGARPIGMLSSLILPSTMHVHAFLRFLDGLDDCCASVDTHVIGGNLKEGPEIQVSGTAIGACDGAPLSRSGAHPGDVVAVVGDLGNFWAGYLCRQRNLGLTEDTQDYLLMNVLTPAPKVAVGRALNQVRCLTACMDNSDGLYPSLLGLTGGTMGVDLDFSECRFDVEVLEVCDELNVDPIRLCLGWGDWQLVVTMAEDKEATAEEVCRLSNSKFNRIGRVTDMAGTFQIVMAGARRPIPRLDSQRFAPDSWFTAGLDSYINSMLSTP